ncbi:hypothetical protein ACB094_04G153100 [Castanea mollissima]
MDLVFHTLQLRFFYMGFVLISGSIDREKSLFEEEGDWERKNRLKVCEGLYCMSTQNFKKAAGLFLDCISTFTIYELFPYDTFIFYTVLTSIIALDRVSLKQKLALRSKKNWTTICICTFTTIRGRSELWFIPSFWNPIRVLQLKQWLRHLELLWSLLIWSSHVLLLSCICEVLFDFHFENGAEICIFQRNIEHEEVQLDAFYS